VSDRKAVLDASAVLAWVLKGKGYEIIEAILPASVIPAPNMTEVLYKAAERGYGHGPDQLAGLLARTGLEVASLEADDSLVAAEWIIKSRSGDTTYGSLSLGDGLCIAVAIRLDLLLVGADQHWETLDLPIEYKPFK
jgi:ribonuclease VapC